jgi:hypothetical protein
MEIKDFHKAITGFINNRRVKRYYLEKSNNGKTYIASLLDTLLFRFVLAIAFLAYFFYMTNNLLFTILLDLQFIILYSLVAYKIKSIRLRKAINIVNGKLAKEQILKDLLNKTPYEFVEFIKEVLEKRTFEDLRIFHQKDIDLLGEFNGETVGIKCFQFDEKTKVDIKDIREFFLGLKELDIKQGFVITTSYFSDGIEDFLPKLEKYVKIRLINVDKLINILKKVDMYPSEREIKNLILERINERKKKIKEYRKFLLSKGKTFKYFFIGIVIYYWGRITPYQRYYSIVSYLLFSFGIISLALSIGKYIFEFTSTISEEKEDDFI